MIYDDFDRMHHDYLEKHLKFKSPEFPMHKIGTSQGFLDCIRHGLACGMVPMIQARDDFKSGKLIDITPGKHWRQDLYWHHQRREDRTLISLSEKIVFNAKRIPKRAYK